jgi:predicted nucleotide-binding protein
MTSQLDSPSLPYVAPSPTSPAREHFGTGDRIFIGHGRSAEWRKLAEFLSQRLRLDYEEFNRDASAGLTTVERLSQMLQSSCFAFLVMTAEDEHLDGSRHARENVVHEVGLFQGRYGFQRAIVLMEDGCTEFSNIAGLGQIRFPRGDLRARSDEIRHVLERERIFKV